MFYHCCSSEQLILHLSFGARRPNEENSLFGITEARFTGNSAMYSYSKFSGLLLLEV